MANIGLNGNQLKLYITDYSTLNPVSSPEYTVTNNANYRSTVSYGNPKRKNKNTRDYTMFSAVIMGAAGDFDHDGTEEIAIGAGNTVYVCKANKTEFKVLAQRNYGYYISSVNALDTNNDGYSELVVITSGDKSRASEMFFYDGEVSSGKIDLSKPSYSLKLQYSGSHYIEASVDIGDLLGDEDKTIVIGGTITQESQDADDTHGITYMKYYPDEEEYSGLFRAYIMESDNGTYFGAMINSYAVKCVQLSTPKDNAPEEVVFCGFIFKYNQQSDKFDRLNIKDYTKTGQARSTNGAGTAHSNITDANKERDEAIILDTIVGNFDGNKEGKEQIILLHYNEWWEHSDYIYVTQCYMDSKGDIYANLGQLFYNGESSNDRKNLKPTYPSICAVDVFNRGVKLRYLPQKSTTTFTNPIILSVLEAPPYYKELEDKTEALGNVATSFGKVTGTEKETSNGFSVTAGVSFGFEQGVGVFGIEIAKIEFEAELKSSFTADFSEATSTEKSVTYSNYYTEDAVVLTVIPYDIYFYEVTAWNSEENRYKTDEMSMMVPRSPLTTMMPVSEYNKTAASIDGAPIIDENVISHTVGDPRTYPQDTKKLSGAVTINKKDPFTGSGIGNVSTEQSISTSTSTGRSFEYGLEFEASLKVSALGVSVGAIAGAGTNTSISVTSSQGTTYTGSVAGVPVEDYDFRWALVTYTASLRNSSGKHVQTCPVVGYLCQLGNQKFYPPKVPENLAVTSQEINKVSLRWDRVEDATGYIVYRSEEHDKGYEKVGEAIGNTVNVFEDKNVKPGKDYYYTVQAYRTNLKSITCEPIYVSALTVNDLDIKRQPKLTYMEYEALDLSNMIVTMILDNGTEVDVNFEDFDKYNLTVSIKDGFELDSANNGNSIAVTYAPSGIIAYTNKLVVKEVSDYPLLLTVDFTVGNASKASYLAPGELLTADINLENTTDSTVSAVAILALYNKEMTMVSYDSRTQSITGGGSTVIRCSLSLPSDVTGYTAKVFVWDGTGITSSNLIPVSDTAQIPY